MATKDRRLSNSHKKKDIFGGNTGISIVSIIPIISNSDNKPNWVYVSEELRLWVSECRKWILPIIFAFGAAHAAKSAILFIKMI